MINLDFCILENPINKSAAPIIFVTRKNIDFLDETVIKEVDYDKAVNIIQNIGFAESDSLTFEFIKNPTTPIINKKSIIDILTKKGMQYNKELEKNLNKEFTTIKKKMEIEFDNNKFSATDSDIKNIKKIKVPKVGDQVTLYFNLFLECRFVNNIPYLYLSGDFDSCATTDIRNFYRPIKMSFMRISNSNPDKIILKSQKTTEGLFKDLPITQEGAFILQEPVKEGNVTISIQRKSYVYNFIEIKNNLPKDNRITLDVNGDNSFRIMYSLSEKIKNNYENWSNCIIDVNARYNKLVEIEGVVDKKMMFYAGEEEFEKAAALKKDLEHIRKVKKPMQKCVGKPMTAEEFVKKFHIK